MKRGTIVAGALFALITAGSSAAIAAGFDSIYVFGDSISDQGNLLEATTNLTFGTFVIPRTDHYYLGRFTNGLNYADDLSTLLGLPLSPSEVDGGNNFAFGGTRTDYNVVQDDTTKPDQLVWYGAILPGKWLDHGGVFPLLYPWTLNAQRAAFADRGADVSDALCVVASGSNDFRDFFVMAGTNSTAFSALYFGYAYNVLAGIAGAVQDFADDGAHDIVVANIPNLGVVPAVTAYGATAAAQAAGLTGGFNGLLLKPTLDSLEASDDFIANDVNIIQLDAYSLLTAVVNDPASYGFSNATAPCYTGFVEPIPTSDGVECENPEEYVFWDKEHPSAAFHAVLAQAVLETASLDMLDYLKGQVGRLDVSDAVRNSLNDKLDGAIQTLTDGNSSNDQAAIKKLKDFTKIVAAKAGKQIAQDDADSMTMRAEKVISLVEAGA